MPNHVRNIVRMSGNFSDLAKLQKLLAMPQDVQFYKGSFEKQDFNFYSLVSPEREIWDDYYGDQPKYDTLDESMSNMFKSNHWYDWNVRNWGTKWNAYEISVSHNLDDTTVKNEKYYLNYTFDTAWSPPEGVIQALAKRIRELKLDSVSFNWWFEEEQGWGGEFYFNEGNLELIREWDIPDSHEEMMERGDYCPCEDYGDKVFDDCPVEEVSDDKSLETNKA